jgi:proline iminopeptidase
MRYWPLCIALFIYTVSSCDKQVQFEEGFVLSGGDSIYYKVSGEGSPLLIIHGGPVLDHQYLADHLKGLSQDHQLIYYDQRACGRSSVDISPNQMTFDFMLKDIEAIRQHLELDQLSILGHSWGGLMAMKYAIAHEEQVDRLILSNSMAPTATWWDQENRLIFQRFKEHEIDKRDRLASSGLMRTTNAAPYIEEYMLLSYKPQFYDTTKIEKLSLYITDDYPLRSAVFMQLSQEMAEYDLLGGT